MNKKTVNNYRITDLTRLGIVEPTEDDSFPICSHCEVSMIKAKDNYFCKECGLVEASQGDTTTTTFKSPEKTGPRIPMRNSRNPSVFFKNITFTQTHPDRPRSKLQELFDAEDEQTENMLKVGGCLIGDEVHTNGPFIKDSLFRRSK